MKSHFKNEKVEKREMLRSIECIIDNTIDILPLDEAKKILMRKLEEIKLEEEEIVRAKYKEIETPTQIIPANEIHFKEIGRGFIDVAIASDGTVWAVGNS